MTRWRVLVAEAALLLVVARVLVTCLQLRWWRGLLGPVADRPLPGSASESDRRLASAVERAAWRLPGESKCLPRAMALHWMLARRGRPAQLVIAIRPGQARGGPDELHAWIEKAGEVLIGQLEGDFHVLARFGYAA